MLRGTAIVQYRTAVAALSDSSEQEPLVAAWDLFHQVHPAATVALFVRVVNLATDECDECTVCNLPEWVGDGYSDVDCNFVCEDCRGNCRTCDRCGDFSIDGYWHLRALAYRVNWCEGCVNSAANYCEDCDTYFTDDNANEHEHDDDDDRGCDCEPQSLHFQILANSHGVLHEDERLLVTLPQGDITDEAVAEVVRILWRDQFHEQHRGDADPYVALDALNSAIRGLGHTWQTREGNYTRRVSKALYQQFGAKLEDGLLSRVGSTVRAYSGSTTQWYVEFTRDLNRDASAFYHEDSCWWSDYGRSRCALKHWGGLALRTYQTEDQYRDMPSGRAWVQPLNDRLGPTTDVHGAHAYVVYNGYGDLEGYTPARLLAYLTSRTYKKINFSASSQYVNSGGYLVADQPTCDSTENVSICRDYHEKVSA